LPSQRHRRLLVGGWGRRGRDVVVVVFTAIKLQE
jgi:hypothetical protein